MILKNRKKAIDWNCNKCHGLWCKNCGRYSCIDSCMLVRGAMSKKLQQSNPWCSIVHEVSQSLEQVRKMDKCHCCEYDVEKKLIIYEDEDESEELGYVGIVTYEKDLEFLINDEMHQDEESSGIFAEGDKMEKNLTSYSVDKSNMKKRHKKKTKLNADALQNSSNTRYLGYLYFHGCYLLIDSPTNKAVDIHGVGRVTNKKYKQEVGIPHCVLSRDSCSRYKKNNVLARSFQELKDQPCVISKIMNIKLENTLGICNKNVSVTSFTSLKSFKLLITHTIVLF